MSGPVLSSRYYDGRRPQARPVQLQVNDGQLQLQGDGLALSLPLRGLQWPERQRHGPRQLMLPDGAMVVHDDGPAWDAWARASGQVDATTVRWMQSWRAVAVALLLTVCTVAALWTWGIPAASRQIAAALPASVTAEIGRNTLLALDRAGLAPSQLAAAEQARIQRAFEAALAADGRAVPAWRLHFRADGRLGLGPNALALPGGDIVLTDQLAHLLADAPDVITGVLAHELGHVRALHGEASIVQAALLTGLAGLLFGDVSGLLATAPVLLGQMAYSRDAEREADADARRVLVAARHDPARMALLFERLAAARQAAGDRSGPLPLSIALASHPADEARIRFFRDGR